MSQSITSSLISLAKHYHALSPTTPFLIPSPTPFLDPVVLSHPDVQSALIELILGAAPTDVIWRVESDAEGEGEEEEEGTRLWKRLFWKRVVGAIETGFSTRHGIDDDITDEVGLPPLPPLITVTIVNDNSDISTGSQPSDTGRVDQVSLDVQ